MKAIPVIFLITAFYLCKVNAQQEIKLYPSSPDEISGITDEETQYGSSWVVNVTEARMYAYFAPEDKANGTAVLVCPGGGYGGLAMEHEGSMVAQWLNSIGISAFVLYYRMPNHHADIPLKDAQKAIELIRHNAEKWKIDKNKVGIAGFSAGGHLASTAGTLYTSENKPDFIVLVYPVIYMIKGDGTCRNLLGDNPSEEMMNRFSSDLQVTENTPPTFIVAAADDDVVSIEHSFRFFKALQNKGVESEMHEFKTGGHSFGLKKSGIEVDNWPELLKQWLRKHNWIPL